MAYDNVTKPSHYCEGRKYEPKDVIRDWDLNFNLGNAVKYISRAGRKGDRIEDLRKAREYIDFEIKYLEAKTETRIECFEFRNKRASDYMDESGFGFVSTNTTTCSADTTEGFLVLEDGNIQKKTRKLPR